MFSQQTIYAMNNPTFTSETWKCTGCHLPQKAGSFFYLGGPDIDRICELCWEMDRDRD